MPGDVRNDLYIVLDKGEFERGGKSTGKNIEVTVVVLDVEKNIVKVTIWYLFKCIFSFKMIQIFLNWLYCYVCKHLLDLFVICPRNKLQATIVATFKFQFCLQTQYFLELLVGRLRYRRNVRIQLHDNLPS